jgi:uncharacterized membrane protein
MASEKLRHQLRKEVQQWRTEGLISSELYEQLASRYQFDELDTLARNRFIAIFLGLGAILLGLALITFVAANWQAWSRNFKVFLLISLFIGINTGGFYLWRSADAAAANRLGQGLLLLGGLTLGANLALMSQMFHQSGAVYQLYLVWGFGVLSMAYSLRLTSLGILAIILTSIGYCLGVFDLSNFDYRWWSGFGQIIQHMPILVGFVFIFLAYWCRSPWLFGLSLVLTVASLEVNAIRFASVLSSSSLVRGLVIFCAVSLVPAWLWAYQDYFGQQENSQSSLFASISRKLALIYLSVLFYIFSFNGWWDYRSSVSANESVWYDWLLLVDLGFFLGLTCWNWGKLGQRRINSSFWGLDRHSSLILVAILATGFLFCWHFQVGVYEAIATIMINLLLFFLAVSLIRQALATGKRLGFWSGILLLSLQLFSRMFEYDTGLLLKAIVLFVSGVCVIAAGLWFERYLLTLNSDRVE